MLDLVRSPVLNYLNNTLENYLKDLADVYLLKVFYQLFKLQGVLVFC